MSREAAYGYVLVGEREQMPLAVNNRRGNLIARRIQIASRPEYDGAAIRKMNANNGVGSPKRRLWGFEDFIS